MTGAGRSELGWRALVGIGACGALVGFAIPAIASSLIRRERQQPSVRLLPAPRLPETDTHPSAPAQTHPSTPAPVPPRPREASAVRAALRRLEQSRRAAANRRIVTPVPQASAPESAAEPSPPAATKTRGSPSGSGQRPRSGTTKPTPVGSSGGTAPGGSKGRE